MIKPIFKINKRLKETYNYLRTYDIPQRIDFGLMLGSFLEKCIEFLPLQDKITLEIANVPNMIVPKIPGHGRTIVYGKLENKSILIFCGSAHLYEGYDMREVVYPVSLLSYLSAANLIVTNSAGGINPGFVEDDIMVIKDHINLMADNPFFGSMYDTRHDYFIKIKVLGLSHIRNIAVNRQSISKNDIKYSHFEGYKKETFIGEKLAKLIENILKKA